MLMRTLPAPGRDYDNPSDVLLSLLGAVVSTLHRFYGTKYTNAIGPTGERRAGRGAYVVLPPEPEKCRKEWMRQSVQLKQRVDDAASNVRRMVM